MEIINNITNWIEIFQKLIIENNNVFEYSTKIVFEHYIILILAFLPFLFRLFFWLYVIQLKEYRWDRFKEYINTPQWNSALINMWSIIEFILLIISFYTIFNKIFEIIILPVFFYFLIIQNIFILRKIIKNRVFVPKITSRLILTFLLLSIPILFWIYIICYFDLSNYLYTYLMSLFIFLPFIIFIILIITLPLVNYKKNKIIKKAIEISNTYNNPIKIWITWSYWKSSVKEYLASILEQQWNTLKTPDNINTELWVSQLIINKLNDKYKYFVAEMWAYRIWEIDLLWKIVNHKHWFLTAIWNQHLW